MAVEREYVLGTNDAELVRLGFQHQVWAEATAASWEHAGFQRGDRILDVGCGPGYVTFALADLTGPDGHVVGVDMSERYVRHVHERASLLKVSNVSAMVHDLTTFAPGAEEFDGAFARWVFCFLPNPAVVIERVAQSLRPGGAFVILDYSHYEGFRIGPPSASVDRIFTAVADSFRAHGGNPDIGMLIPTYMRDAGLDVTEINPLVRIGRPGTALWDWPRTFFAIFLPTLVETGRLTPHEIELFWQDYEARTKDSAAFFMSPPMVEVVGVKR